MLSLLVAISFIASLLIILIIEKVVSGSMPFVLDQPGKRKVHTQPVPRIGGLAFFIVPLFISLTQFGDMPVYFILGLFVVYLGGILDDIVGFKSAKVKFIFQLVAALIFVIGMPSVPGQTATFHIVVSVLALVFILFLTNAMNLMDNMNGLTSGMALTIIGALCVISMHTPSLEWLQLYFFVTFASLFAFYIRNFPKGLIFMGDQGSQFLGYLLSSSFILISIHVTSDPTYASVGLSFAAGVILFSLFLYDTVSVIYIRRKNKLPITQGDTNHISHRLVRMGFSQTTSSFLINGAQILCALLYI
jgi:UDP-GlcNAc:undecaprenyl-phosphate/decaprenyl-phosphate GlcNAc-1-phosphate transferase